MGVLLMELNRKTRLRSVLLVCVLCLASGAVRAKTQFAVFDKDYGIGGTAGNYTIRVNGQGFDRTVSATLTNDQGSKHQAVQYYRVGPEILYATFDLTTALPGLYDVVVEKGSTAESLAIRPGLQVIAGGGGAIELLVVTPDESNPTLPTPVNDGSLIEFQIVCQNTGINDSYVPVIQFRSDQPFSEVEVPTIEDADMQVYQFNDIWYPFPQSDESCPGIVLPNSGYARSYWMESDGTDSGGKLLEGIEHSISHKYAEAEEINWVAYLKLHNGVTEQERFSIIEKLQSKMNNKVSSFYAMLSGNAQLVNREDLVNDLSYYHLVRLEIDKVLSSITTSISGRLSAASFETPISNISITANNLDTGEMFRTTSMYDGSFRFNNISGGSYEISTAEVLSLDGLTKVQVRNREQIAGLEIPVDNGYCVDLLVTLADELVQLPAGGTAFLTCKCEPDCDNASSSSKLPTFKRLWGFTESNTLRISGLFAGEYDVAVDIPGYAESFASFTLLEGSEGIEEIPVNCVPGITVTGTVTSEFGQVLDKFAVLEGADEGNSRHIHFAEWNDLRFEFQDVLPGNYKLSFSASGYATIVEQVDVEADSTSYEIGEYDVPPERMLSVRWTGGFANKGDDATAIIFDLRGNLIRALPIQIGTDFTIDRLAAQEYSFGIFDSGTGLFETVVNLADSQVTELQIRSSSMAGAVSRMTLSGMITSEITLEEFDTTTCWELDPIADDDNLTPLLPFVENDCSATLCKAQLHKVLELRETVIKVSQQIFNTHDLIDVAKAKLLEICLTYKALCPGGWTIASLSDDGGEWTIASLSDDGFDVCPELYYNVSLWAHAINNAIAHHKWLVEVYKDGATKFESARKEYEWCKTYACDIDLSGTWWGLWWNPTTGEGGHMILGLNKKISNPTYYSGTAYATGTGFTFDDEYASYNLEAVLTNKNTIEMSGSLYIDASEIEDLWFIASSVLKHTAASIVDGTMWGTYTTDWLMDYGGGETEWGLGEGWFYLVKQ